MSSPGHPPAWPVELRFSSADACLRIAFDDGLKADIPYELLRVESPSAETRGHGAQALPPPGGKRGVRVTGAEPVGRYAVRLSFSDGHDSGLYPWSLLRELAEQPQTRMDAYLARLAAAGRARG